MEQLVFDFFKLCSLNPVEIRKGVWQVQADDGLMKELDGWRSQGRLLQFTFDQRLAEIYGADLICPGSYRLNSILQVIRKQGRLSQAHIPHHYFHEPSIQKKILGGLGAQRAYVVNSSQQYAQYREIEILTEVRGLHKKESLHTVVVNLFSGKVLKFPFPTHLLRAGGVPQGLVGRRGCSFKQAFANAAAHLHQTLAQGEQKWAEEAHSKLVLEESKLREFFVGNTGSDEFKAKQQELHRRLHPVMRMDALRGALLFTPLFRYRLVVVDADGSERTKNLSYDPIGNLQELD